MLAALLAAGLLLAAWLHRGTLYAIAEKWVSDAAFSHGFLILPIAAWLAWRRRADVAAVPWAPSWAGIVALAGCTLLWIVARGGGVLVLEQLAVVAMAPALVLAVLGWRVTRVLAFPLAFLAFVVPFGRALVPHLMQVTADVATQLLRWTGVPVLRSNMYIEIPAGSFEVAVACSGLNYFITGLVLGMLYAYLTYRRPAKRLLCVAAFTVIPVLLNGLRVYFTILAAHLTDMRFGPGDEHVTFGRIFFVAMMLAMFWIGRRWHDIEEEEAAAAVPTSAPDAPAGWRGWLPLAASLAIVAVGPSLLGALVARSRAAVPPPGQLVAMPEGRGGWAGPRDGAGSWRPHYSGGLVERQSIYTDPEGASVDVFVAVYGIGATSGAEMISYNNVLYHGEFASLVQDARVTLPARAGGVEAREMIIRSASGSRIVWQWFVVGERPALRPATVKLLEAGALVGGYASSERIVTLSTSYDPGARDRLRAFAEAYADCIPAGFGETCGA